MNKGKGRKIYQDVSLLVKQNKKLIFARRSKKEA
jgi:hypothetical protein